MAIGRGSPSGPYSSALFTSCFHWTTFLINKGLLFGATCLTGLVGAALDTYDERIRLHVEIRKRNDLRPLDAGREQFAEVVRPFLVSGRLFIFLSRSPEAIREKPPEETAAEGRPNR